MKKIISFLLIGLGLITLASCAPQSQESGDIINPDADFVYFYGATCPHCQELNKKLEEEDMYNKVALEKREVYYNNVNRDAFLEVTKKLGLESKDTGVPFVLKKATGEFATGVNPALELLKSDPQESTNKETEAEDSKTLNP